MIPTKGMSRSASIRIIGVLLGLAAISVLAFRAYDRSVEAQTVATVPAGIFRIGEKLSYNLSFGKIQDAGYAELQVFSRGKLSGKDAVELRAKLKTIDLVSAAFVNFDSSRTTFANPETGLPLYVTSITEDSAVPKETIRNFLAQPTSSFDLLSVIYKARAANGGGSFPLFEGDRLYTVTFQPTAQEKIRTLAGEFDTTISTVQSDYLTAVGIKDLKINLSTDGASLPVLVRMKTAKGEFRASLTSVVVPEPAAPTISPSPTPSPTPKSTPVVRPSPTPVQYVDNMPLIPDLGFGLGEVLDYQISSAGKPLARLTLSVKERKLVDKNDTLVLTATISGVEQGTDIFKLGESAQVFVDPDSLAPSRIESKFTAPFVGLKQTLTFDRRNGSINFGEKTSVEAPIGTHSYLSLLYAMRSFNLKPSKDASNPVNDTRVAVFWDNRPYVFTLRPSVPEELTIGGEKMSAQRVVINTGNKDLDQLGLKVWLRTADRVPVKITAGVYEFDLVVNSPSLF